jgi:hypothetical protein
MRQKSFYYFDLAQVICNHASSKPKASSDENLDSKDDSIANIVGVQAVNGGVDGGGSNDDDDIVIADHDDDDNNNTQMNLPCCLCLMPCCLF